MDDSKDIARLMRGDSAPETRSWKSLDELIPAESELYLKLVEVDLAAAAASTAADLAGHHELRDSMRALSEGAFRVGIELRWKE